MLGILNSAGAINLRRTSFSGSNRIGKTFRMKFIWRDFEKGARKGIDNASRGASTQLLLGNCDCDNWTRFVQGCRPHHCLSFASLYWSIGPLTQQAPTRSHICSAKPSYAILLKREHRQIGCSSFKTTACLPNQ